MSLFSPTIQTELEKLEPLLVDFLKTPSEPTNQIIAHIIQSGGKRIRPGLFLLSCDLIGYTGEHRYPIAAVCEYIHTASLLHDDVIDNSPERRGRPTVNSKWGDETAVLAGDLIYSAACRLMVKTGSLELIDTFAECIRLMSESELFQLELLWKEGVTREDYLRVVRGKTAFLFGAAVQTPNFLAKTDRAVTDALASFGSSLGIAFQVADDCLDYTASELSFGKPAISDLYEGKSTLPLIMALEHASSASQAFIRGTLRGEFPKNPENQSRVQDIVISNGGVEKALQFADTLIAEALEWLEKAVAHTPSRNAAALSQLKEIAGFILQRSH